MVTFRRQTSVHPNQSPRHIASERAKLGPPKMTPNLKHQQPAASSRSRHFIEVKKSSKSTPEGADSLTLGNEEMALGKPHLNVPGFDLRSHNDSINDGDLRGGQDSPSQDYQPNRGSPSLSPSTLT